ncbi:MAG: hypothetical protein OS130_13550 [Thermodesulfobacteriota bacterium]|jgi:hypothetical protein|nr:MAG: hypothetical protein OS130_13550 [Thermodesulfobacteriota bacterium]
MLRFFDNTQIAIIGLDEILANLYIEGRQVSIDTAEEIVKRLEVKNHIPASARKEYRYLLMKEYREYVEAQTKNSVKI